MQDGQACPSGIKKCPKQYFGTIQNKILSQNEPKNDEKWLKIKL